MYIGSIDEKSPFVYTSVFLGFRILNDSIVPSLNDGLYFVNFIVHIKLINVTFDYQQRENEKKNQRHYHE